MNKVIGALAPTSLDSVDDCRTGGSEAGACNPQVPPVTGFKLHLPAPPSVNRFVLRLGNKSPVVVAWAKDCDKRIMAMKPKPVAVHGPFAITIIWSAEKWDWQTGGDIDNDNRIKPLLDYLQRIELIDNDKLNRRQLSEWGLAPLGCVVHVQPVKGEL